MKAIFTIHDMDIEIDLDAPLSIGIPLNPFDDGPTCFYAEQPSAAPITSGDFIGSVDAGAPVNFYSMKLVPHGNGTHTECIGHISSNFEKVNHIIANPFYTAELISIEPEMKDGDLVITADQLGHKISQVADALVIRTLPNLPDKKWRNYSETNPPYLTAKAMHYIVERGYQHLLIDLPSVDKEKDNGAMRAHKIFWSIDSQPRLDKTITEMIFVNNDIEDGRYLLNLKISNIVLDAVPSEPILYRIKKSLL